MSIQTKLHPLLEPWMPHFYQLAISINAIFADDAAILSIIFI